jgi:hypothetical protein
LTKQDRPFTAKEANPVSLFRLLVLVGMVLTTGGCCCLQGPSTSVRIDAPTVQVAGETMVVGGRDAWWSLCEGMSKGEVLRLLGTPECKSVIVTERWCYRSGRGWVAFDKDDEWLTDWVDPF